MDQRVLKMEMKKACLTKGNSSGSIRVLVMNRSLKYHVLLLVILKVTRSEDSERTRNESKMEESESESEEGKTVGDISNLKLQKRAV